MRKKIIALLALGLMNIGTWSFFGTYADPEAPFLSVGDKWNYTWIGEGGDFPRTVTIDRIEDFEEVQCYVFIDKYRHSELINRTEITWMTSDWVILKTEELETNHLDDLEQRITRIYTPGKKLFDFPLSVGKEWSGRSYVEVVGEWSGAVVGEGSDTGWEYVDWVRTVVAKETVTVPAGTFDTYVIEEPKYMSGERFWFCTGVQNYVKHTCYILSQVESEGSERARLTSYELAPQENEQGNGSSDLSLPIALGASIGVLGFTSLLYYRRNRDK